MILFFMTPSKSVIATAADHKLSQDEINELCWLYGGATPSRVRLSRASLWVHAAK